MIRIYMGVAAAMIAAAAAGAQTADDAIPAPPAEATPAPPAEASPTQDQDPATDPMTLNELRNHYDARFADYEARFLDYDLRLEGLQWRIAHLESDATSVQSSDAEAAEDTPQVPTAQ